VMLSYFSTCLNMRWMLLFIGWHHWLFNPAPPANILAALGSCIQLARASSTYTGCGR
jgi:hypothetical protein